MDKSMKSNVMGMLWTAGAVVVGIVVANLVNTKLLAKKSAVSTTEEVEGEE
tara:strand:+ start:3455 stop:3607 length:153 start_codon:yes stop_codon:yes gene_type:complete